MGLDISFRKVRKNSRELAYFRKVNFLVKFFEDYFGKQIKNCEDFEITKGSIIELRDRCNKVLKNHDLAKQLLPTTEGFFFGSTDYDDRYFKDVAAVLRHCDEDILPQFDKLDDDEYIVFHIWY